MVPVRRLVDLLVDLEKIFSTDLENVGIVRVLRFPRKTLLACNNMVEILLRKSWQSCRMVLPGTPVSSTKKV